MLEAFNSARECVFVYILKFNNEFYFVFLGASLKFAKIHATVKNGSEDFENVAKVMCLFANNMEDVGMNSYSLNIAFEILRKGEPSSNEADLHKILQDTKNSLEAIRSRKSESWSLDVMKTWWSFFETLKWRFKSASWKMKCVDENHVTFTIRFDKMEDFESIFNKPQYEFLSAEVKATLKRTFKNCTVNVKIEDADKEGILHF